MNSLTLICVNNIKNGKNLLPRNYSKSFNIKNRY